jgi:hypothetical protein
MLSKDNYMSVSLPMMTKNHEVVFFYYASTTPDGGFVLDDMGGIFFRDLITSEVTVKSAVDIFSPSELARLTRGEKSKGLVGSEVLDAFDVYLDLHEQVLGSGLAEASPDLLARYVRAFVYAIPKGPLRTAYGRIGKEMFEYAAQQRATE